MKTIVPVLTAGGAFAAATLAGLLLGVLVGQRTGQPLWAFAGLMIGLGLGGFGAVRLLMRSI
ncbi:MAG TPA: hypothetical protein VK702_07015 [Candidatus Acidoferrum sp.]|jgi:hypothetical protein|nr:hypothetical protein [Candidatus Acidoferrum sp.]